MFSVEFDSAAGFIRCRIEGFLSSNQVSAIIESTKAAKEKCKRLHGDMKMLVVTDGQVQSVEAMKMVAVQRAKKISSYDRRAFVLPTSLQKLQVCRTFNLPTEQCFISEKVAITWLLADREHCFSELMRPVSM
ncbi:hypothetical protein [Sphingomonas sp. UYP23]